MLKERSTTSKSARDERMDRGLLWEKGGTMSGYGKTSRLTETSHKRNKHADKVAPAQEWMEGLKDNETLKKQRGIVSSG